MIPLSATPLWAALLAVLFLALSARAILGRRRARVAFGHGRDPLLERILRSHANFAEYVPLALLLMATAELSGTPRWLLHLTGLVLLAGRLVHAYCLVRETLDLRLRPVGMGMTFTAIAVLAVANLLAALR